MKRFYQKADIEKGEKGFFLRLDGKAVKTPAKRTLSVPSRTLARALVKEWAAQGQKIDPLSMPLNRLANTALDRTQRRFSEVVLEALNFARHDLLCYRAEEPESLIRAEQRAWDPYLEWAAKNYGVKFRTGTGIASVEQPPKTLKILKDVLNGLDAFTLTAVHNATTLSGSLILALALKEGHRSPAEIWRAAHVDEDFQIEKWGFDDEARKLRAEKKFIWQALDRFLKAL